MADENEQSGPPPEGEQNANQGEQQDPPLDPATLQAQLAEVRQSDRSARQRIRELESHLDELQRSQMSEQERAIREAADQARAETEQSWSSRYLSLRVERLAAVRLADPSDATRLLDLSKITAESTDDQIANLIDQLLKDKPYLSAKAGNGSPPLDRGPQQQGSHAGSTDMNELMRSRLRH